MLPRDHSLAVILAWPLETIATYVCDLQASLIAMRPIIWAAQEWAANPTDDDLEMRLFLAVANYRLPIEHVPGKEDRRGAEWRAKLRAAHARRREAQETT